MLFPESGLAKEIWTRPGKPIEFCFLGIELRSNKLKSIPNKLTWIFIQPKDWIFCFKIFSSECIMRCFVESSWGRWQKFCQQKAPSCIIFILHMSSILYFSSILCFSSILSFLSILYISTILYFSSILYFLSMLHISSHLAYYPSLFHSLLLINVSLRHYEKFGWIKLS